MKKSVLVASAVGMIALASCGGGKKAEGSADAAATDSVPAAQAAPEYRTLNLPTVDLAKFTKDKDGWINLFDGKTFDGWRGYGREDMPARWTIEDGCIKMTGSGKGECTSRP